MNVPSDPLHDLLRPPAQGDAAELRERVRGLTGRIVRRRRLVRYVTGAAALAAAVLAIIALVHVIDRSRRTPLPETAPMVVAPTPQPPADAKVQETVSPIALEWQAFDSQTNRAANYFLAGNKYLEANQDMESALRCYAQALDACTADQLDIAPDDNWLVVSLKNARRKENSHE